MSSRHTAHENDRAHRGHAHAHEHGHEHGHHHGHAHVDPTKPLTASFAIGVALNLGFVVAEVAAGVVSDSTALIADATHNLGDVLGLLLAWGTMWLSRRPSSATRTYGFKRSTVLAALTNAVILLVAIGGLSWEAALRLQAPAKVEGSIVMWTAACGVLINGGSALLFARGQKHDANVRAAFLHLAADAAISLGVVIAGLAIMKTGFLWLDPAVSLGVSLVILFSAWSMLRDALHLALDGVPSGIDLGEVRAFLSALPGVLEVHDLHVWALSTTQTALTAHLVAPEAAKNPRFLHDLEHALLDRFAIDHATLQIEPSRCHLAERDCAPSPSS